MAHEMLSWIHCHLAHSYLVITLFSARSIPPPRFEAFRGLSQSPGSLFVREILWLFSSEIISFMEIRMDADCWTFTVDSGTVPHSGGRKRTFLPSSYHSTQHIVGLSQMSMKGWPNRWFPKIIISLITLVGNYGKWKTTLFLKGNFIQVFTWQETLE